MEWLSLELWAVVFTMISVWLTVRQNIWCWPTGVVGVLLYMVVVFQSKLYADTALQVFFFFMQFYGWHQWLYGGKPAEPLPEAGPMGEASAEAAAEHHSTALKVSRMPARYRLPLVGTILGGSALLGTLTARLGSAAPFVDSTQTVMSVLAQFLMSKKYIENWILWIIVNIVSIWLYFFKGLYLMSGQYAVFLVLAFAGYYEWRKSLAGSPGEPVAARRSTFRLLLAVLSPVLAFVALGTWITLEGRRVELVHSDCIIVPGSRSLADGTPGLALEARTMRAVDLYRQGWAPAIIFTGGKGASGTIESEVGRSVALEQGVPRDATFVEVESHNTWENFLYAREVMREHHWKSCLIATDAFHSMRCCWIARDQGLEPHPAPTFEGPSSKGPGPFLFFTTRECFSILNYGVNRALGLRPSEPTR